MLELGTETRSKGLFSSAPLAAGALAALVLFGACGPGSSRREEEKALSFARIVPFQTGNVTTDLISIPEGIGLTAIDHGWQPRHGPGADGPCLSVAGKLGRLEIFSADGDLEEIELELARGDITEAHRLAARVVLNGQRLDRVPLEPRWQSFKISLPAGLARRGTNILELAPRYGRRAEDKAVRAQLLLRRVRIRSGSGRPVWSARPQVISADDGIGLPVASFLDLVLEVPDSARLVGSYAVEMARRPSAPAWAYIQLLDPEGREWTLLNRRLLKTRQRRRTVDLDLSAWAGQLVRLRLGTTGPGNGVVHWHGMRVTGMTDPELLLPLPPISRAEPPRTGGRSGRPDVFVVLLDAARADAFSPFGGPYPTPATERLAAEGTVFKRTLAPAPWTAQSVPSMLTGLYPDTIRIGPLGSVLPREVPTLPQLLQAHGYRTLLWSQHPLYQNHRSFQRGFEEVHKTPAGAYDLLPTRQELVASERPTFAWIHLIPPHAPYQPPRPFAGSLTRGAAGAMSVEATDLGRVPHLVEPQDLSEANVRYARDRYQENVAFADSLVGRLLATLDEANRYRNSLVVLLSDHGEAFLEHGVFLHTRNVHTEMLHVPLVVKWPAAWTGFEPQIASAVSLVDLVPTLVDGLGLAGAEDGFQGRSLLPLAFEGETGERALYAVTRGVEDRHKPPKPALMLQSGPWRILHDPLREASQLYLHREDPSEIRDLASQQPLQTLLLRQSLLFQRHSNRLLLAGTPEREEVEELDPEAIEQLQALGYLN